MANGDDDPTGGGADPSAPDAGPPSPPGQAPPGGGGPPGSPPSVGGPQGPILAALAKQQSGPQVSAPGQGNMGDSLGKIQQALAMIESALPGLRGTRAYMDAADFLKKFAKHLPQGAPAAGQQQTGLLDLIRGTMRNAVLQKVMQQQGGPGAPQGPSPSPPLPGA